ncbi:hypothetical protein JG688_00010640 [Phytophthora aleatoria]|uniref:Uncharacterized protein n=1 Tax=Phytophthora aleatoria TaxID=2496075 RepID=A0A8J5J4S2_9STRA|nr:hypothetical protein JG688_00010640 [Phytophthora aleatoria]
MVATQAGDATIWMMMASLARVISTLPIMSKLLRCQAARAWVTLLDPVEPVQLPRDNAKGGDAGSGSD